MKKIVIILMVITGLSACGQMGALYQPGDKKASKPSGTTQQENVSKTSSS